VTCFLSYKGKILLLKRGSEVGTYHGKWAAVSGYIEDQPVKQAYKEIREKTGLGMFDVDFKSEAESLNIVDEKLRVNWVIYSFPLLG
jgi:ADP-ribose pyrophosphatase YjhB (NUDIX family)